VSFDLSRSRRLFFVGLGGIGMSALARLLRAHGHVIAGSDQAASALLDDLRAEGITAFTSHAAAHVATTSAEAVIISAAIRPDNPELQAAHAAGLPVLTLAELAGQVAAAYRTVAIAGTHGKTTTTSMVAYALERAGLAPSFLLGGLAPDLGGNARFGAGDLFVIEADEYAGRFLSLQPDLAAVTILEPDHPDVYPDWASLESAFRRWLAQVRPGGLVVLRGDDPGCLRLAQGLVLDPSIRRQTFALAPATADWVAMPLPAHAGSAAARYQLMYQGAVIGEFHLRLPGAYNIANACAAVALCTAAGLDPADAATALASFAGVSRRFEVRGTVGGITVIDDYAHHPSEVRAVLAAARERYPGARLWCLFQPHTYSRTRLLFDDFAAALRGADVPIVCAIYAAREEPYPDVSAERLAAAIGPSARHAPSVAAAAALAAAEARPGDVILTVGAGDITQAGPLILAHLRR
jgi:UDP-N-acetylmuramate--alanine ligase